jgi:hypothetical protein
MMGEPGIDSSMPFMSFTRSVSFSISGARRRRMPRLMRARMSAAYMVYM